MSDALLCESLLAWACLADYHEISHDFPGAVQEVLNGWLRAVGERHRAELRVEV